ncbi:serine hydrolase domain-containing protein [Ulvibacterium sp.]|uniref:serine hydrolase domain-containing protein n=1 Tax=Ulvibacterium sp. TaxID=2665914 RepID=UPI003BAC835F
MEYSDFRDKPIRHKALFFIWLMYAIVICSYSRFTFAQTGSKYQAIDSTIERLLTEKHIPGFALCIVKDSTMVWSKSYGEADREEQILMDLDAIMNIGSISKTFTATAALQLWERGLLDFDEDINDYLDFRVRNPKYPESPITVFQILTHTSSIQDGKSYSTGYSCGDPIISLRDWVFHNLTQGGKYYGDGKNFAEHAPGEEEKYSNLAFGLLGYIVEKIARMPFRDYTEEHIFKPLEMNNTGWFIGEIDRKKHIRPYLYVTEENRDELLKWKRLFPNESEFKVGSLVGACLYSFPNYPDGLVRTSVRELSFFLTAMMNGGSFKGRRILKGETVGKMFSLQIEGNNHRGLCWYKKDFGHSDRPLTLWGHNGTDPGIQTNLFLHPTERIGVVTFQNKTSDGIPEIIEALYLITQNQ